MNKTRIFNTLALSITFLLLSCTKQSTNGVDKEVEAIIAQMSLEEKVGQMAQITLDVIGNGKDIHESKVPFEIDSARLYKALVKYHVGSILNTTNNYALPPAQWNQIVERIQEVAMKETHMKIPVLYGIDAIHGATYSDGATMFPQQITLAASFNPKNAFEMARISAYETRACGIPWVFSPVLDLGADPRFSRQYEGFGEDPYLIGQMGVQMIKGYEGTTDSISAPNHVASCLKHFLGYSVPYSGKDRTPAYIPEHVLREYHLAPFKAAVEAGTEAVMINSGIINGISVHANHEIITDLLKTELQFDGVVVSDWMDIINLYSRDKIASSTKEAIKLAVNAGIDMSMIPYEYETFCQDLVELVQEGQVEDSRVDDAVRRILKLKKRLNLWEKPSTKIADYPEYGSAYWAKVSYEATIDAITLLKNKNAVLPLPKTAKVLVCGPNANSMRSLCGGWSYSWQGEKTERYAQKYNTILEAIQKEIETGKVQYVPGVSYVESGKYFEDEENQFSLAVAKARQVDYVVLCVGENSYTEKPGDLNDLSLSKNQTRLAKALAETGTPVILVLNEGRPRCISSVEPNMSAIVQTYLPGVYGGDALADILFGDANPSGRLPYTYPSYPNSIVTYYHKPSEEQKRAEGAYIYESDYNPQYEFGHGLSYTTFEYGPIRVSDTNLSKEKTIRVSIDIKNTGKRFGKESVLLFSSDLFASMTPDMKRLRLFEKIGLNPGETKTVSFEITPQDLAFVQSDNQWVTEPGTFELSIGNRSIEITYNN